MSGSIGRLRERLLLQSPGPVSRVVTSLTRTSTTATATTRIDHGFQTGDYVTIAGALPAGYVGKVKVTVTGLRTFTYPVVDGLTTPATGTLTAVYVSDAQGGRSVSWIAVDTVAAELIPLRAWERLQAAAIQIEQDYRFRIRVRADVTAKWRALWTPRWPPSSATQALEITGVLPDGDGRSYLLLECSKAPGV